MNSIDLVSAAGRSAQDRRGSPTPPNAAGSQPGHPGSASADNPALRKAFDQFVGETFYGQMIQAMRKSQGKPAYFHGGQAEEIFTQQLDQVLSKKLAETSEQAQRPDVQLFTQSRK